MLSYADITEELVQGHLASDRESLFLLTPNIIFFLPDQSA